MLPCAILGWTLEAPPTMTYRPNHGPLLPILRFGGLASFVFTLYGLLAANKPLLVSGLLSTGSLIYVASVRSQEEARENKAFDDYLATLAARRSALRAPTSPLGTPNPDYPTPSPPPEPTEPLDPPQSEQPAPPPQPDPPKLPTLRSPVDTLTNRLCSALVCGVPGAGKGMVVSNALRVVREAYPDVTITVVDPKADPKERGYWDAAHHVHAQPLGLDSAKTSAWVRAILDEFLGAPSPKLLVLDELSALHNVLDKPTKGTIATFLNLVINQGDSNQTWVWAITQTAFVQDLPFNSGTRANLISLGIIAPHNRNAVQALMGARGFLTPPKGGEQELNELMGRSPVKRAFFDGSVSGWFPMPQLENHSGHDRDKVNRRA